jgi:hypothetical protein
MKSLFLIKILIAFHYSENSPKIRTTTFKTILTASGGFGREANSFRLLELMLDTDFLASSINGWTSAN